MKIHIKNISIIVEKEKIINIKIIQREKNI